MSEKGEERVEGIDSSLVTTFFARDLARRKQGTNFLFSLLDWCSNELKGTHVLMSEIFTAVSEVPRSRASDWWKPRGTQKQIHLIFTIRDSVIFGLGSVPYFLQNYGRGMSLICPLFLDKFCSRMP